MEEITRDVENDKRSIRNELIQRIKYCGQYIVDNAEAILGQFWNPGGGKLSMS